MPGGDRTGPLGIGAMSGRAAGHCAGFAMPGYANPIGGFGRGRGRAGRGRFLSGRGRGWRNIFHATGLPGWARFGDYAPPYAYPPPYHEMDPQVEKRLLKDEAEALKSELDSINKRLTDLEPGGTAE